jgi:hypothetical protein
LFAVQHNNGMKIKRSILSSIGFVLACITWIIVLALAAVIAPIQLVYHFFKGGAK